MLDEIITVTHSIEVKLKVDLIEHCYCCTVDCDLLGTNNNNCCYYNHDN